MRQSTRLLKPNEAVATNLVLAENNKSVPTATAGGCPKTSTNRGVIKEPPPTPVSPTRAPTTAPHRAYRRGVDMKFMRAALLRVFILGTRTVGVRRFKANNQMNLT